MTLISIAEAFADEDPLRANPVSAFELQLCRRGRTVSRGYVARLLAGPLSSARGGAAAAPLVEVSPGRFRLRTESDGSAAGPLDPPGGRTTRDVGGVAVPARPKGCRAAILAACAELASADPAGLIRSTDIHRLVAELGDAYSKETIRRTLVTMAGVAAGSSRALGDLERVRRGVYRLVPAPDGDRMTPQARACRHDVVEAVRRLSSERPDGEVHVTEIRAALPSYSVSGIRSALRRLVAGEPDGWRPLARAARGWYRMR